MASVMDTDLLGSDVSGGPRRFAVETQQRLDIAPGHHLIAGERQRHDGRTYSGEDAADSLTIHEGVLRV